MERKIIRLIAFMLLVCILTTSNTIAQQLQSADIKNYAVQTAATSSIANYTYKIFQAPNKMFGYDIFCNGKIIFHQPASIVQSNNAFTAIAKKEHAEKAALFAVEKIKKNEPATLTQEEIKKIVHSIK